MKLKKEQASIANNQDAFFVGKAHVGLRSYDELQQENAALTDTLTRTQARCTELLNLNRALDQRARVREFMLRSEQPIRLTPGYIPEALLGFRLDLVVEEVLELLESCGVDTDMLKAEWKIHRGDFGAPTDIASYVDLVALADALADIDYVVEGFRQTMGIDGAPIAAEVHRSNWEKVCHGIKRHPETGKVMKPNGWKPPQIAEELEKQGVRRP